MNTTKPPAHYGCYDCKAERNWPPCVHKVAPNVEHYLCPECFEKAFPVEKPPIEFINTFKPPAPSEAELKPCPCCNTKILNVYATSGWFKIQCSECGLVMVRDLEIDNANIKAITAWNHRASTAAVLGEVLSTFENDTYASFTYDELKEAITTLKEKYGV